MQVEVLRWRKPKPFGNVCRSWCNTCWFFRSCWWWKAKRSGRESHTCKSICLFWFDVNLSSAFFFIFFWFLLFGTEHFSISATLAWGGRLVCLDQRNFKRGTNIGNSIVHFIILVSPSLYTRAKSCDFCELHMRSALGQICLSCCPSECLKCTDYGPIQVRFWIRFIAKLPMLATNSIGSVQKHNLLGFFWLRSNIIALPQFTFRTLLPSLCAAQKQRCTDFVKGQSFTSAPAFVFDTVFLVYLKDVVLDTLNEIVFCFGKLANATYA